MLRAVLGCSTLFFIGERGNRKGGEEEEKNKIKKKKKNIKKKKQKRKILCVSGRDYC